MSGVIVIVVMTLTTQMKLPRPDLENLRAQLIGYCIKKDQDKMAAEDFAQESIARYFDNINKGVKIQNVRAWLFRVVRNLIVDSSRMKRPHLFGDSCQEYEVDPKSVDLQTDDDTYVVCGEVVPTSTMVSALPRAMKKLTSSDRKYLDNYYFREQSFSDLAVCDRVPVSTTKGRMYRARLRLRAQLEADIESK